MNTPQHIAFIMDGNRRWAKERHLPLLVGHSRGYERMQKVIDHAKIRGIKHLTFWAFSTENWKRSEEEVGYLLTLFRKILKGKLIADLIAKGGRIHILGEVEPFPDDIKEDIDRVVQQSKDNTDIVVNIALNYGGRLEIMRAVKSMLREGIDPTAVTDEVFSQYLFTNGQPDPDLIIRTGGEQRLSGFLPWQGVYSELYFSQVYWPDFDEKEFDRALEIFAERERRFGK